MITSAWFDSDVILVDLLKERAKHLNPDPPPCLEMHYACMLDTYVCI